MRKIGAVILIILSWGILGFGPQHVHAVAATTSVSVPAPLLAVGNVWHFHYSGATGDSVEQDLRTEACGSVQCIVGREVTATYNDTYWITPDYSVPKEYCKGCDGPNVVTKTVYTPPFQVMSFPLQIGKSWWLNTTQSGWTLDSNGNHTFSLSSSALRRVINETTVTVPAGTFDTFLVAQYPQGGSTVNLYRWWSPQAENVAKILRLDQAGNVMQSQVMVSYSLAPTAAAYVTAVSLVNTINAMNLPPDITSVLNSALAATIAQLQAGNKMGACSTLVSGYFGPLFFYWLSGRVSFSQAGQLAAPALSIAFKVC
jgi:hypothetical protein